MTKRQKILISDKRPEEKFSAPAEISDLKRVQTIKILGVAHCRQWPFSITACSHFTVFQQNAPKHYALRDLAPMVMFTVCDTDSPLQAKSAQFNNNVLISDIFSNLIVTVTEKIGYS